jgi:uncharacterized RDD family membrane protein YckC
MIIATMLVFGGMALIDLLALPFRSAVGHAIFRLAVVDGEGAPAGASRLLVRWAIIWLPLLLPMAVVAVLLKSAVGVALILASVSLLLWIAVALYAVGHPHRGLHDGLAGTWVVRR